MRQLDATHWRVQRAAALGKERPAAADWISDQEATILAYSGHLQQARAMSRRAVDLAQQAAEPERAAMYEAGEAVTEAFFGNPAEARRSATRALGLSKARDVEYGAVPGSWFAFFGNLYPVYVRGEAYLAAHQGAEAASEFQKILDHGSIVFADSVGAMARLRLGRAVAVLGDKTKAKTAYQNFFTLWKDADGDIPILKQAKLEYAQLQ